MKRIVSQVKQQERNFNKLKDLIPSTTKNFYKGRKEEFKKERENSKVGLMVYKNCNPASLLVKMVSGKTICFGKWFDSSIYMELLFGSAISFMQIL